jgi:hypothetical protein
MKLFSMKWHKKLPGTRQRVTKLFGVKTEEKAAKLLILTIAGRSNYLIEGKSNRTFVANVRINVNISLIFRIPTHGVQQKLSPPEVTNEYLLV